MFTSLHHLYLTFIRAPVNRECEVFSIAGNSENTKVL